MDWHRVFARTRPGSSAQRLPERDVSSQPHVAVGGSPSPAPAQTPWRTGRADAAQLRDAQTLSTTFSPHRSANYLFSSSYYIFKG